MRFAIVLSIICALFALAAFKAAHLSIINGAVQ